jgi:hypothetical protein
VMRSVQTGDHTEYSPVGRDQSGLAHARHGGARWDRHQ